MQNMNITDAQYIDASYTSSGEPTIIRATIDGEEVFVPIIESNRHYKEIMRQVEAGELTIEPAD